MSGLLSGNLTLNQADIFQSNVLSGAASAATLSGFTPNLFTGDLSTLGGNNPLGINTVNPTLIGGASSNDLRVRIKTQQQNGYGPRNSSNILNILYQTDGMIFPYTPQINYSQDVDYQAQSMVQSNIDYYSYTRTPSVNLSISGKFTIQNDREGEYALACIHFLRTSSKMYFGEKAAAAKKAGLPPPILILNGYGTYMFNNLKVILKNHSFNYDENMDIVDVRSAAGGITKLPAMFTLSVNLIVQQTPNAMRTKFDLDAFRTGQLLKQGGWI